MCSKKEEGAKMPKYQQQVNMIVSLVRQYKRMSVHKLAFKVNVAPRTIELNYRDTILEHFLDIRYDEDTKEFYLEGHETETEKQIAKLMEKVKEHEGAKHDKKR